MVNRAFKQNVKTKYKLTNLIINNLSIGWITPFVFSKLEKYKNLFNKVGNDIEIIFKKNDFNYLSNKINDCLYSIYLKDKTGFGTWCDENTCVSDEINGKKYFYIQRAATGFLGVKTTGVHLNGYKIKNDAIKLIIAKRSNLINSYPGLLDTMVSGFLPMDSRPKDKIYEEAYEEAGIDKLSMEKIKFVNFLNFVETNELNCKRGTLIIFDLLLPELFSPKNNDGEVAKFITINLNKVYKLTKSIEHFKFDSRLVAMDFLLRKGFFQIKCDKYFYNLRILRQNIDNLNI